MKVLLTATSLQPAYGGPAYSVSRLAIALNGAGVRIGLWTADQSVTTTPLLPPSSRIERLTGSATQAFRAFGADVVHDNGMWLPHNHRFAKLALAHRIPRVVSTRGMLQPWAIGHKRWKKRLAWSMYQRRNLQRARHLHATSHAEAQHLSRLDLGVPIDVISNGVDIPAVHRQLRDDARGTKTALFLGRLYPVKGLPMLIEAWSRVRPAGWRLQIAGPDEAGHRAEIERAIAAAGIRDVIDVIGRLDGEAKLRALVEADLFVLPTHSESFGMAIAEALAHGLPVLTTTAAPWLSLPERGCGWIVEPSIDAIVAGLRESTSLDSATLHAMGAKGREWMAAAFTWDDVATRFLSVYDQAIAGECSR